jgi:hypothetical protein
LRKRERCKERREPEICDQSPREGQSQLTCRRRYFEPRTRQSVMTDEEIKALLD